MKLLDEVRINASRETVYDSLNDPEVLKKCIPGCEKIEKVSESELKASVIAKIGPIKAKFLGQIFLSDLNPPKSYTISGEGQGGVAGFAKGVAKVFLEEDGRITVLKYELKAEVGGKIAQLGGRLIEGTAKKLAGEFFNKFKENVILNQSEEIEVNNNTVINEAKGIDAIHPFLLFLIGSISIVALIILLINL
ncbi:MAG: carbon monoxide dehydrogenase subunit G [Pseudomonadota bacterium]|nr:carbon monoxide dehydrogenase subunit G [Pseudomonadota bacterium]